MKSSGKVVAQIYFPTDKARLSGDDVDALYRLVGHYKPLLTAKHKVKLCCVGRADKRFDPDYNRKLSHLRALNVKSFLDRRLIELGASPAGVKPDGERYAGNDLAADRRVDVFEWYRAPKRAPVATKKWTKVGFWLDLKAVDVFLYKKLVGSLAADNDDDWIYAHRWNFNASNLSIGVSPKGKPPVWLDDVKTNQVDFQYDASIFKPWRDWKKKGVSVSLRGKSLGLTIHNAFPKPVSTSYMPIKGLRVGTRNMEIDFKLAAPELGVVTGLGGIDYTGKARVSNRA